MVQEKQSHCAWEQFRQIYESHYNKIQLIFSKIFEKESLLSQSIDSQNAVRRVAATCLMYLGDLNRFKANFEAKIC